MIMDKLTNENLTILAQGIELLRHTPPAVYRATNAETFGSSSGAHFRHVIQHYQSFLAGVCAGHAESAQSASVRAASPIHRVLVDYDLRDRTVALETDVEQAIQALQEISFGFETHDFSERQIEILQNYDPAKPKRPVPSSIARELTFLISHSIHHYALIGVILRLNGIEVPRYFGFAPSTIYYLNSLPENHPVASLVSAG